MTVACFILHLNEGDIHGLFRLHHLCDTSLRYQHVFLYDVLVLPTRSLSR